MPPPLLLLKINYGGFWEPIWQVTNQIVKGRDRFKTNKQNNGQKFPKILGSLWIQNFAKLVFRQKLTYKNALTILKLKQQVSYCTCWKFTSNLDRVSRCNMKKTNFFVYWYVKNLNCSFLYSTSCVSVKRYFDRFFTIKSLNLIGFWIFKMRLVRRVKH